MKKYRAILIVLGGAVIAELFFFGIQFLWLGKKIYAHGEDIRMYVVEFKLSGCDDTLEQLEVYKKEGDGWKYVWVPKEDGDGMVCIDGNLLQHGSPMCDTVTFFNSESIPLSYYEKKDVKELCTARYPSLSHPESTSVLRDSYISKKFMPVGEYKVRYGLSEAKFSVR